MPNELGVLKQSLEATLRGRSLDLLQAICYFSKLKVYDEAKLAQTLDPFRDSPSVGLPSATKTAVDNVRYFDLFFHLF